MKNKRLNNKGFVIVETLIVAVTVSAIFALVFKHFYPLIGEYERREDYDDIDSKYGTYWIKRMLQDRDYKFSNHSNDMYNTYKFRFFNCKGFSDTDKREMCYRIVESLEVSCDDAQTQDAVENCSDHNAQPHIYITDYNLEQFKSKIDVYAEKTTQIGTCNVNRYDCSPAGTKAVTSGLQEYVRYLPRYKFSSLNGAKQRIIIEYYRHRFDTPYVSTASGFDTTKYIAGDTDDFLSYGTIEVKKDA